MMMASKARLGLVVLARWTRGMRADVGNTIALECHVTDEGCTAAAVINGSSRDEDVVSGGIGRGGESRGRRKSAREHNEPKPGFAGHHH